MDDADVAKQYEIAERDSAIESHRQRAREHEKPIEIDGVRVCIDCAAAIPEERVQAYPDAVRCVRCKQEKERPEARR